LIAILGDLTAAEFLLARGARLPALLPPDYVELTRRAMNLPLPWSLNLHEHD
jgi:hypothetical protein